ncbi:MAG: V-type ATP synthase subunit D [Candidatus Longimicrobiales bacterium M2_2A_002]
MAGENVAPTRGNLLELRDRLDRVHRAHRLLSRKREALLQQLQDAIAEAEELEQEFRERIRRAHRRLMEARMRLGSLRVDAASLASADPPGLEVGTRPVMGVDVPVIDLVIRSARLPYGPGDTDASLDRARAAWQDAAELVGELAEKTDTVWRLAAELRRTERRVNALEDVVIPRTESAVAKVEDALSEAEREEIVHAKKVKSSD